MKKVSDLTVGDYIAFAFSYRSNEPKEIIVSNITSVGKGSVLVHFLYGHHSLAEYIKFEDILAIGSVEGNSIIHGWSGRYDIINSEHPLIKENAKTRDE